MRLSKDPLRSSDSHQLEAHRRNGQQSCGPERLYQQHRPPQGLRRAGKWTCVGLWGCTV